METNDAFATTATIIGFYQMLESIRTETKCERTVKYILLGIISSVFWMAYQYRKGAVYALVWSQIGLLFQMYFLKEALDRERSIHREDDTARE